MSNKTLLSEAQIRQFMKLAKLEPLTPGFVHGLAETHGRGLNDAPQYVGRRRVQEEEDLEKDEPLGGADRTLYEFFDTSKSETNNFYATTFGK